MADGPARRPRRPAGVHRRRLRPGRRDRRRRPRACAPSAAWSPSTRSTELRRRLEPVDEASLAGHPQPHPPLAATGRWSRRPSFVSGHSYMQVGFSTATEIRDVGGAQPRQPREVPARPRTARTSRPRDRNIWGVTFADDDNTFYATVGTGGETYLVQGDLAARTLTVGRRPRRVPVALARRHPDRLQAGDPARRADLVDPGRARPRHRQAHRARRRDPQRRRPGRVARRRHPALRPAARRRGRRHRRVGARHARRRRRRSSSSSRPGRRRWCGHDRHGGTQARDRATDAAAESRPRLECRAARPSARTPTCPPGRRLVRLADLAPRGLATGVRPGPAEFAQTVRAVIRTAARRPVQAAGHEPALRRDGGARPGPARRRGRSARCSRGRTAAELVSGAAERALDARRTPGPWRSPRGPRPRSAAPSAGSCSTGWRGCSTPALPLPTVDVSWMLTAAVAAQPAAADDRPRSLDERLAAAAPPRPARHLPAPARRRVAAALARPRRLLRRPGLPAAGAGPGAHAHRRRAELLERRRPDRRPDLRRCRAPAGQWWWHYDARDRRRGRGLPGLQRAPARDGADGAVRPAARPAATTTARRSHRGLGWLRHHPEVVDELISTRHGLVWRKVGRREPRKAARALGAATTSAAPGLHVPGVDRVLAAGRDRPRVPALRARLAALRLAATARRRGQETDDD